MWRFMLSFFAFLAVAACSHGAGLATLVGVCQGYNDALADATARTIAGKLTATQILAVKLANEVVIGDPDHSKPGLCTTPTPSSNPAAAVAVVVARTRDVRNTLAMKGLSP